MLPKFDIEIVHKTFFLTSRIKNESIVVEIFKTHEIPLMPVKSLQLSLQLDTNDKTESINDNSEYFIFLCSWESCRNSNRNLFYFQTD